MPLSRTTLSAAVAVNDVSILIASLTGLEVKDRVVIDAEVLEVVSVPSGATVPVPVRRGLDGSAQVAHAITSGVTHGLPSEFAVAVPGAINLAARSQGRNRTVSSYGASGALALPTPGNDAVAILNGTVALAMTLANPGTDHDGDVLIIAANGAAAHTVTYTAGLGGGGAGVDVATFAAGAQNCLMVIAANARWVPCPSLIGGVATVITVTVA